MSLSVLQKIRNLIFVNRSAKTQSPEYDPELVHYYLGDGFQKLKARYAAFKSLLSENNAALSIMNDLQEKVSSQLITLPYFEQEVSRLLERILAFVQALNDMCQNKYVWLFPITEGIKKKVERNLETGGVECCRNVYFLGQVSALMANEVGGKAANIGEVKNILRLPAPRGLVISSLAYRELIAHNHIDRLIRPSIADLKLEDDLKIKRASAKIQKAILEAKVPASLKETIEKSLDQLKDIEFLAVRSSAIGEDGKYSFAGQFRSVLNVPKGKILDAYKEVCASLYGERAIYYRLSKGITEDDQIAMAVLVLEMIPAVSSGVFYTVDPSSSDFNQALANAVWGLGKYAVDGTIPPDVYVLDRVAGGKLINQTIGQKGLKLVADPEEGRVKEEEVPLAYQESPCLAEEKLQTLYEFGQLLEKHFGLPQDIEWAIDEKGWIHILQTRTLEVAEAVSCPLVEVEELPVISGEPIGPGVISAPVFVISGREVTSVPRAAILVVKTMDPEFAKLIPMCSGLICETGSATTHLATVARESQKPTVINAESATTILHNEEIITLDANRGKIYKGRIDSLLKTKFCEVVTEPHQEINLPLIRNVMTDIVPLTLTHIPGNANLSKVMRYKDFKTIHDMVRFIHEVSVREMFQFGGEGETGPAHVLIDPRVPLVFLVVDIEQGLASQVTFRRNIAISDVRSTPFTALWKGMTTEGLPWTGPVEFDLGGFFSVLSRSFVQGDVTARGGKAYIILSKDYLNFHCRLAYHFSVVDAVCGNAPANNYVAFRFGGGGAGADGRMRRVLMLKEILEALDFRVEVEGDTATALFRSGTAHETEVRLVQLGRLMGFTRQLDMTLHDESILKRYAKAFLEGDYSISQQ